MRDLIISIAAVALLIGTWLVFFDYSSDNIDSYTYSLKKEIIPAVEAEQWEESKKLMKNLLASGTPEDLFKQKLAAAGIMSYDNIFLAFYDENKSFHVYLRSDNSTPFASEVKI